MEVHHGRLKKKVGGSALPVKWDFFKHCKNDDNATWCLYIHPELFNETLSVHFFGKENALKNRNFYVLQRGSYQVLILYVLLDGIMDLLHRIHCNQL